MVMCSIALQIRWYHCTLKHLYKETGCESIKFLYNVIWYQITTFFNEIFNFNRFRNCLLFYIRVYYLFKRYSEKIRNIKHETVMVYALKCKNSVNKIIWNVIYIHV